MKPVMFHPWDLTEKEASLLQLQLASKVITADRLNNVKYVAGVDVAYCEKTNKQFAAVVVFAADSLNVVDLSLAEDTIKFPYIPGLFSFRELPPIVKALNLLNTAPDLIICDGQGLAHPQRCGLACHLGVLFDIPTIGCGKSRLIGKAAEPGIKRGDCSPLWDSKEMIGMVLRTRDNIKPVYVSIGHRVSLQTACNWILKLTPTYRLPETTRKADHLLKQHKKRPL